MFLTNFLVNESVIIKALLFSLLIPASKYRATLSRADLPVYILDKKKLVSNPLTALAPKIGIRSLIT